MISKFLLFAISIALPGDFRPNPILPTEHKSILDTLVWQVRTNEMGTSWQLSNNQRGNRGFATLFSRADIEEVREWGYDLGTNSSGTWSCKDCFCRSMSLIRAGLYTREHTSVLVTLAWLVRTNEWGPVDILSISRGVILALPHYFPEQISIWDSFVNFTFGLPGSVWTLCSSRRQVVPWAYLANSQNVSSYYQCILLFTSPHLYQKIN